MAIDPARLAGELREAERTMRPVELLTSRFPSLTWEDARAVARHSDELRLAEGDQRIGYKLGWTSAQMREALGIDRPNWGTLWASQLLEVGALDCGRRIHPKIEPELVYRCGGDLVSPTTASEVNASGEWALGLEVVDPRFPSFDFDWLDNTADNSSSAVIVVGDFRALTLSAAEVTVVFTDANEEREGIGANALGDPGAAVAWLVDALAVEGARLDDGDIVFTGGLTAPFDVSRGDVFSLESPVLPSVVLRAA